LARMSPMTETPVLAVDRLQVSYGPISGLRGCTLEVRAGETVAVVGANGAGKTTLLRAICNMLPWTGAIRLDGVPTDRVPTHKLARQGVLHLTENRGILATQTVLENLQLAFDTYPSGRSFAEVLKEAFTHFPRLKERQHQPAGNLSGGEQQMLALARAIISTPKILLLDEPSLGLSPRMVREAYRVLRGFKARGMAILLVEQNVHAALRFANRGYVLRQGVIVRQGEADVLAHDTELFSQYLGFT
jgi:branched-chain amino acid transport system ATP-binding protein